MPFNFGDIPLILQELRRYFASKAQGTLADSALQPGAIGSTVQAYHARLDSLSGITNADGGIEKTGANTYGRYALTTFGKNLIDDADATAAQATLNLVPGANVQAWDADLDALAAIATTGPVERTGPGTWGINASLNSIAALNGTGLLERTGVNTWGLTYGPTLTSLNSGPLAGDRNRIINGNMSVAVRGGAAAIAVNNTFAHVCDRWLATILGGAGTGTVTVQRITDGPAGLPFSSQVTVTNAKSPSSSNEFHLYQSIEGVNVTDLAFNTPSAKTLTLSFWVKSSLTGSPSGHLRTQSGTTGAGATYRSYVFTYTINVANTWEQKTITIPGDTNTTSGFAVNRDTRQAMSVLFDLGSGSSWQTSTINSWQAGNFLRSNTGLSLIGSLNATWQVTGVQLEVGTAATPFEHRSYGAELALCQRYYELVDGEYRFDGWLNSVDNPIGTGAMWFYRVEKRALPTLSVVSEVSIEASAINGLAARGLSGIFATWYWTNTAVNVFARNKAAIIAADAEIN